MKIPVATTLKNRSASIAKDARMKNAFAESRNGILRAVKRPSINGAFDAMEGGDGLGQGLFTVDTPDGQTIVGIQNDVLNNAPNPKTRRLSFGVQPTAPALNTVISPSITVRILNSLGALVSSATNNVTLAIFDNETGATLGGTLTQAAVGGVATFNDITLNHSGSNFTIRATATGLNAVVSNPFTISTQFAFTTQPSNVQANTDFTVAVTARDSAGNTDTEFDGSVTLSLYSAIGNGVPTGDFIVNAVAGVATFANISISDSGISGNADGTYSFIARADSVAFPDFYIPAAAVSNSFTVATFTHTLTAAQSLSSPFIFGFDATAGSISPTTLSGRTITALYGDAETPTNDTVFTINGAAVSQSFFTSLEVVGVGTLLTASATSFNGNTWQWGGTNLVTSAGTFLVNIT